MLKNLKVMKNSGKFFIFTPELSALLKCLTEITVDEITYA